MTTNNLAPTERSERLAVLSLGISLLVGWVGNLLFFDFLSANVPTVRLGFLLFIVALVTGILVVARLMQIPFRWQVLWLLAPIGFFAGMVAVRAEAPLTSINVLLTIGLGGIAVHYLPLKRAPHQDSWIEYVYGIAVSGAFAVGGFLVEATNLGNALRKFKLRENSQVGAIVRGIVFAIPIFIVFAVLLASADTIFSDRLLQLFGGVNNFGDIAARILTILMLAWFAFGLMAYGGRNRIVANPEKLLASEVEAKPTSKTSSAPKNEKPKGVPTLGMIETTIIMGSIIGLFAVFVLIQLTYLFGEPTNFLQNTTYAQYARRGFFELVAVAVLVIALGRYLHLQTRRQSKNASVLFGIEAVILVGLTLVVLASAWYRMGLYEAAFGFTHLRLYVYIFMVALAALMGFFLLEVLTHANTLFSFALLLTVIGYGIILNGVGGESFIAERNINRYEQGTSLDICYLRTFSVDALPQMLRLLDIARERGDTDVVDHVSNWLVQQSQYLASLETNSLVTFNVSNEQADSLLSTIPTSEKATWLSDRTVYCYG